MDIVNDILASALGGGAKLSTLLYGSSLSSGRLQRLLPLLMAAGLLTKDEGGYATSEKGKEYMKLYQQLMALFSIGSGGSAILDPALLQRSSDLVDLVKKMDREKGFLRLEGRGRTALQAAAYYILANREAMPFTLYDASRLFGVSVTPVRNAKKLIDELLPK